MPVAIKCMDHLGNEFNSVSKMCRYWKIDRTLYNTRIANGLSVEEALTKPLHSYTVMDHLGNTYKNIDYLCFAYNISRRLYEKRLKEGKTQREALEAPKPRKGNRGIKVVDHTGQEFNTINAMCRYWELSHVTYNSRIKRGLSIKEALETPVKYKGVTTHYTKKSINTIKNTHTLHTNSSERKPIIDHTGTQFESISKMCRHWKVDRSTFEYRLSKGATIEEALTQSRQITNGNSTTDHLGNTFKSIKDMCKHWNVSLSTYYRKYSQGYNIREILEPEKLGKHTIEIHAFGRTYYTCNSVSKAFGIDDWMIRDRIYKSKMIVLFDTELLVSISNLLNYKLEFISIDNKAWYKVPWSENLKNTRDIIKYCRPDLLNLYDKNNSTGEWHPFKNVKTK